jgi:hypothetical protein
MVFSHLLRIRQSYALGKRLGDGKNMFTDAPGSLRQFYATYTRRRVSIDVF